MHFLGRLDTVYGVGVNNLIKEGAILITSPNDIFDEIPEFKELTRISTINHNNLIKKEYRKIYSILSDYPMSLDEISMKTENDIRCTLNLLSLMELEDLVDELPGAGYVKKYKD